MERLVGRLAGNCCSPFPQLQISCRDVTHTRPHTPRPHLGARGCCILHKSWLVIARCLQYRHCSQVLVLRRSELGVAGGAEHGAELAACSSSSWRARREGAHARGAQGCSCWRAAGAFAVLPVCPSACTATPASQRCTHWVCRGPGSGRPSCTACLGEAPARQGLHTPQHKHTTQTRAGLVDPPGERKNSPVALACWAEQMLRHEWLKEEQKRRPTFVPPQDEAQAVVPQEGLHTHTAGRSGTTVCVTTGRQLTTLSCLPSTMQRITAGAAGTAGTSCDVHTPQSRRDRSGCPPRRPAPPPGPPAHSGDHSRAHLLPAFDRQCLGQDPPPPCWLLQSLDLDSLFEDFNGTLFAPNDQVCWMASTSASNQCQRQARPRCQHTLEPQHPQSHAVTAPALSVLCPGQASC